MISSSKSHPVYLRGRSQKFALLALQNNDKFFLIYMGAEIHSFVAIPVLYVNIFYSEMSIKRGSSDFLVQIWSKQGSSPHCVN